MADLSPKTTVLGYDNAAHLLRRATFKVNKATINAFASKTPAQALADLFTFANPNPPGPLDDNGQPFIPTPSSPRIKPVPNDSPLFFRSWSWWLSLAAQDSTLQYRIVQFLHSIFVIAFNSGNSNIFAHEYDYLELLRLHAKGSLKELARRMTRCNVMLYYLGNRLNTASAPNQNYAREFLELFTITKGPQIAAGNYTNYTEQDVQQAARVLTGFTVNSSDGTTTRLNSVDPVTKLPQGILNINNHDKGNKTFSAAFNNRVITGATTTAGMEQELQTFVDMVFAQLATAQSYARRLYRFFVHRDITDDIETGIITPLANTLLNNDYNLQTAITQLLSSKHFYDEGDSTQGDNIIGAMVKSPLELNLHFFTQFEVPLPSSASGYPASEEHFFRSFIRPVLNQCVYPFLQPFSVNGYAPLTEAPEYDKLWIATGTLPYRYNGFVDQIIKGSTHLGFLVKLNIASFVRNSGHFSDPANASALLQDFFALMLTSTPTGERYEYFLNALLGQLSAMNWKNGWDNYMNTSNDSVVKIALQRLVVAIVKSPEYQVM